MNQDGLQKRAAIAVFLFPIIVYICTLARHITFVDSGELCAVAATLGIAHPPGYPLYTVLGYLFSIIPASTIPFRIGLLSALSASFATLLLYQAASRLLIVFSERTSQLTQPRPPAAAAMALAPMAGALLFAFSLTVWGQAVVVEVYTLQTLLVILFLGTCARAFTVPARAVCYWPWVAFAAGLAL
ncbi:DUF2723 domain-containing protein, partial [Candidatus Eisenbacteria bacterium]